MPISVSSRTNQAYSFADHANPTGGQQNSGLARLYVKNNAVDVYSPSYGRRGNDDGLTVVRLLPCKNEDNPQQWTPFRVNSQQFGFGDWVRKYRCVRRVGPDGNQVTFIVNHPEDPEHVQIESPYDVLYRAIATLKKQKSPRTDWTSLLDTEQNRGAALPKPQDIFFVHAVLMRRGGNDFMPPLGLSNRPILLELTQSAARALFSAIEEVNPNSQTDPSNWSQFYRCGDSISFNDGAFFTFYKRGDGDPRTASQAGYGSTAQNNAFAAVGNPQFNGMNQTNRFEMNQYACFGEKIYNGTPSNGLAAFEPHLQQLIKPWADVLQIADYQEQAEVLSSRMDAEMLQYAWQQHPQYMTATLKSRLANRFTSLPNAGFNANPQLGLTPPGAAPAQAYGQPAVYGQPAGFGQPAATAYGQPAPAAYGQSPAFGQSAGFGQPAPAAYTQPPAAYGQPSAAPVLTGDQTPPAPMAQPQSQTMNAFGGAVATQPAAGAPAGFGVPTPAPMNNFANMSAPPAMQTVPDPFGGTVQMPINSFGPPVTPPPQPVQTSTLPAATVFNAQAAAGAVQSAPPIATTSLNQQPADGFMPRADAAPAGTVDPAAIPAGRAQAALQAALRLNGNQ